MVSWSGDCVGRMRAGSRSWQGTDLAGGIGDEYHFSSQSKADAFDTG